MTEELPSPLESLEIIDPHNVPTVLVDWLVTGGIHDGVVNLTLGTVDHSLTQNTRAPKVAVCARLRLPSDVAERLHNWLGAALGKQPVEDPPPEMPQNKKLH